MKPITFARILPLIVALTLAACGGDSGGSTTSSSSSSTPTGPSATPSGPATASCSGSVSGNPGSVSGSGGRFTLTVTTGAGCSWTTQSDVMWASVSPASGVGSGSPVLVVEENTDVTNTRSANVVVAGQTLRLSQGNGCIYTVDMSTAETSFDGGDFNIHVTTRDGCAWTASATEGWVHLNPTRGSGSDAVNVDVDENRGGDRHATVTIAGKRVTVNQQGHP